MKIIWNISLEHVQVQFSTQKKRPKRSPKYVKKWKLDETVESANEPKYVLFRPKLIKSNFFGIKSDPTHVCWLPKQP